MPLTKEKKKEIIDQINELLESSKITVVAAYPGTTVQDMQTLRRQAKENGTSIKVLKNRLVKKALESNERFKDLDTGELKGQLLYAFNSEDEVAPAQTLANFAKTNPTIEFVGAITSEGTLMSADEVRALATLPSKPELITQVLATLGSPLNDVMAGLSGNLHGLLDAVAAKASN